jgi:hypothetical protein
VPKSLQLVHGQSFTINGAGFGTKSRALSPLVRDVGLAAQGTVDSQWNSTASNQPTTAGGNYNLQNQPTSFQGSSYVIGSPHPYVSQFLSGCHLNLNSSTGGNNVSAGMTFTPPGYPYCIRASWYFRFDPAWSFDPLSDNNLKDMQWFDSNTYDPASGDHFYTNWPALANQLTITNITNAGQAVVTVNKVQATNPFNTVFAGTNGNLWYFSSVSGMTQINGLFGAVQSTGGSSGAWTATFNIDSSGFSAYTSGGFADHPYNNGTTKAQMGTDAYSQNGMFQGPNDANGHETAFWNDWSYPMNPSLGWIKREYEMCVTSSTGLAGGGYLNVYDNYTLVCNYAGKTDNTSDPTHRGMVMGYYARDRSATNFRYFADAYIDVSDTGVSGFCAAVFVGNNQVYSSCTVREPSIATAWSDSSITFTFWKGALAGGSRGYIFVKTEAGIIVSGGSYQIA